MAGHAMQPRPGLLLAALVVALAVLHPAAAAAPPTTTQPRDTSAGDPVSGFFPQGAALTYRADAPWFGKAGVGGRWDGFDYADARNAQPTRYCPSNCRSVSTRVARCGCVTRASLNTYYNSRRSGGSGSAPVCCYLRSPPVSGGASSGWSGSSSGSSSGTSGGGSSSGTSGGGSSSGTSGGSSSGSSGTSGGGSGYNQNLNLQLYAVGACKSFGLRTIEASIRSWLSTLKGVEGSTIDVVATASVQSMSKASAVVRASRVKVLRAARGTNSSLAAASGVKPASLPPNIDPNVVCAITAATRFNGPNDAASLTRNVWETGGPCNKLFNNLCGNYYTLEATLGCISEPSETPIQFASCEYLSQGTGPTPPPSPPSPPPSPPSPPPSPPSPPPSPPSPPPSPPSPPPSPPSPAPVPSPSPVSPPPSPPSPPPVPSPSPSPAPYTGDKDALVRSMQQNDRLVDVVNWDTFIDEPVCIGSQTGITPWTGVVCLDPINSPGVIDRLNLAGGTSPFGGTLPDAWADLQQPTVIDVGQNFLTGTLPDSWKKLTSLKILRLANNNQAATDPTAVGLSGSIPKSWAALTNLVELGLGGNILTGTFPPELSALTKLELLSVDRNGKLKGFLPASYKARQFQMSYGTAWDLSKGVVVTTTGEYGVGGQTLYTGSGPLWRSGITNWEGQGNNAASNPSFQPDPDPCVQDPTTDICICRNPTTLQQVPCS